MKVKLTILYVLLFAVLGLGAFCAAQFFLTQEEVPEYEYYMPDPYVSPEPSDDPAEEPSVVYDFEGLLAQNDDFIGWLTIPDTYIDFPVVQCGNNQWYLTHAFDESWSIYGCPFLDTRTPLDGENLVIHGHNMGNNQTELFSTLLYFEDPEYAGEHSVIRFLRPDREGGEYALFAVLNANIYDEDVQYIRSGFDTEEDRTTFLSTLQDRSLYPSEGIPDGQILILSTCNRFYGGDNRLLIVAVETSGTSSAD